MLATVKLNGLESHAWLKDTLEKLPAWPYSRIDELLPLRPQPAEISICNMAPEHAYINSSGIDGTILLFEILTGIAFRDWGLVEGSQISAVRRHAFSA
jgi:hypothetical protein